MADHTQKQKIGRLGEDIAIRYIENKGFLVIQQNYLKKCGEIDIIAKKAKKLHFIEVKTVSRENMIVIDPGSSGYVSLHPGRESDDSEFTNSETDKYRAEDNIHEYKLKRLVRTIQLYLLEKHQDNQVEWQLDAIIVELNVRSLKANVKYLDDIVV